MKRFFLNMSVRLIGIILALFMFSLAIATILSVGSQFNLIAGLIAGVVIALIGVILGRIAMYRYAMKVGMTEEEWYAKFGFLASLGHGLREYESVKRAHKNFTSKVCPDCNGTGEKGGRTCGYCGGTGEVSRIIN